MPETRTLTTARGRSVTTPHTDLEAMSRLTALVDCGTLSGNSFARDLANRYRDSRALSRDQWTWVHILVVDAETPRTEQPARTYPGITLRMGEGRSLCLGVAGAASRVPGAINVTDCGRYPSNTFFGRIHQDGRWEAGRNCTPEVLDMLDRLESDPATLASNHGHTSGRCCFCNLRLDDERSVTVGYGPVCADNYGLPWGNRPAREPNADPGVTLARTQRAARASRVDPLTLPRIECPECHENAEADGHCGNCGYRPTPQAEAATV